MKHRLRQAHIDYRPLRSQAERPCVSLDVEGLPPGFSEALRASLPQLIRQIAAEISREVSSYTGHVDERRSIMIAEATHGAMHLFLDLLENRPTVDDSVLDLFYWMGHAEARSARGVDALRAAQHTAIRLAWQRMQQVVTRLSPPPHAVNAVVSAMFTFGEVLVGEIVAGHELSSRGVESDGAHARHHLVRALLMGAPSEELERHMTAADWTAPARVAIVTAHLELGHEPAWLPAFDPDLLAGRAGSHVVLLVDIDRAHAAATQLADHLGAPVAISWEVGLEDVTAAFGWVCRALALATTGVIEAEDVIDCSQHRLMLWLHAEPTLARATSTELLAVLEAEKPHQRLVLGETMLLWLKARESAPVLARRLNIHEQTARRRLKIVKDMFAEPLTDPHNTLPLLSALEIAVPQWRAADLSQQPKYRPSPPSS